MILTDKQIKKLVNDINLIAPFKEEKLQSESYDLTLGNMITTLKKETKCIDIAEQNDIDSMYKEYDMSEDGYVISPQEYIIVSVEEQINLPENISAHIRPKTTANRLGLMIANQHCNSTYTGFLKLGLFNATNYPIRLRSGYSIAQIVFEELVDIPSENKQYKNKSDAHYQNEGNEFRGAKFDTAFLEKLYQEMLK